MIIEIGLFCIEVIEGDPRLIECAERNIIVIHNLFEWFFCDRGDIGIEGCS